MKKTTLRSLYSFPGFQALATLKEVPEDPGARIIVLRRRQKKQPVPAVTVKRAYTIGAPIKFGTWTPAASASIWSSSIAGYAAKGAMP
jgi:hypothetical protein